LPVPENSRIQRIFIGEGGEEIQFWLPSSQARLEKEEEKKLEPKLGLLSRYTFRDVINR